MKHFKDMKIGETIDISDEINEGIDFIEDEKAYEKVGEKLGDYIINRVKEMKGNVMAKDKEEKKSGTIESPEIQKVSNKQTVMVMFRENRKFDLHVGRDVVIFRGRELKPIPKSWLTHPDFKQQSKKFIVKGV